MAIILEMEYQPWVIYKCHISHPKSRISHPYITNLLQRYDIIKEWVCISKNQRKVGGHYEDSGL